jgi:hypothetical protein
VGAMLHFYPTNEQFARRFYAMASAALLTNNTPGSAVQVVSGATLYPSGVFDGAHIILEACATQNGTYEQAEFYNSTTPKNITLSGGGWVKAYVGNEQPDTDLSLTINTP